MTCLVMKFGGTSVADATCMRQVRAVVERELARSPLVVLSAVAKTTDALFKAARTAGRGDLPGALEAVESIAQRHRTLISELLSGDAAGAATRTVADAVRELDLLLRSVALVRVLDGSTMDLIASFGERLSTRIFSEYLSASGMQATLVDARRVLRTDDRSGSAQPILQEIRDLARSEIAPHLGRGRVVVTQGYIGSTAQGVTTTLGRGGSDYSAALFGAALAAVEVQIWTDVEGVLTADPRVVPAAIPVPELSFAEAAELAAFGAKVLHPATIQPAVEAGVPVTVRDTFHPTQRFTTIAGNVSAGRPVTALAMRGPITVLTVTSTRMLAQSGFLAQLFSVFARRNVSVDVIATAEVSVSMTVEADAPIRELVKDLSAFATVSVSEGRAIVAVVGERLKQTPGLSARVFSSLIGVNIEMISMGANEINLSLVVEHALAKEALQCLHRALIEGRES